MNQENYFKVVLNLPANDRSRFIEECSALVQRLELESFMGMIEGSVQDHSASEFDVGEADPKRDWVKKSKSPIETILYFGLRNEAESFVRTVAENFPEARAKLESELAQDWNQKWKDSFEGLDVPPHWKIRPSWTKVEALKEGEYLIRLDPSFGFGFGNHPTTRMCLEFLGSLSNLEGKQILDFGSGSGILSVACALKGAQVWGVEIDDLARESSKDCFQLNKLADRIQLAKNIREYSGLQFDGILANIISKVLIENAEALISALKSSGFLFLSGILENETDEVLGFYLKNLQLQFGTQIPYEVFQLESWSSIAFKV